MTRTEKTKELTEMILMEIEIEEDEKEIAKDYLGYIDQDIELEDHEDLNFSIEQYILLTEPPSDAAKYFRLSLIRDLAAILFSKESEEKSE